MRDALRRLGRAAKRGWRRLVGDSWRLAAARVLAVLVAIGIGGFAFVSAGLMPIAASEGHWAVTRVFLHYVMRRSVATATIGLEAPPLDDPALVAKGAGHYATGCLPCHGAPGVPRSPVVERMLPVPPYLPDVTGELTAEETFSFVGGSSDDPRTVARGFLRSQANTIEGGTSAIMRNILGERVLGLPKDPDPSRDVPWKDVPRSA